MNDFLSKFSGKNYDKILDDQPLAESQPAPTEKEEAPRKESSQPTARRLLRQSVCQTGRIG